MLLLTLIQQNNDKLSNYKTYCSDYEHYSNYKHNRNVTYAPLLRACTKPCTDRHCVPNKLTVTYGEALKHVCRYYSVTESVSGVGSDKRTLIN
jgi:hypothetical protein